MLKNNFKKPIVFLSIVFAIFYTLFPFIYMISVSFKIRKDIFAMPPKYFNFEPTLYNYWFTFFYQIPFFKFMINSFIITSVSTIAALILGTLAGYSLARFRYPGNLKYHLSFWILSTRMLPPIVVVIPLFLFFSFFNLVNTKLALIIAYTAFNIPFVAWMMRSFFLDIPKELEESAMVDGDTRMGSFRRIILPLAKPGLAATSIFCLILSWNEFLFAVILTETEISNTVTFAIALGVTQYQSNWGYIAASATISVIPIIIFAFIVQKHLVRGLSFGAIKG
jgi:multiple sugar transport system permease protein